MPDDDNAYKDDVAPDGSPFRPLYDDRILFDGQPIALVVAEEPEIAQFAASLVRVDYDQEPHVTDVHRRREEPSALKPSAKTGADPLCSAKATRRGRESTRCRRSAPSGRIFRADRASQPDGALCVDGHIRGRWQAHDLRQDPRRAERPALPLRRTQDGAGRRARHVALHGWRLRIRIAPTIPGGSGRAGGARVEALGARRAHPTADVWPGPSAGNDPADRARCQGRWNTRDGHARCRHGDVAI